MKKEIDLGFMKQGRIAVNCKTRSDFYALCMAIGDKYPEYKNTFMARAASWEYQCDDEGLALRAMLYNDGRIGCGYCQAEWYRSNNYKVIQFEDICYSRDYGDFNSGFVDIDAAIAALF